MKSTVQINFTAPRDISDAWIKLSRNGNNLPEIIITDKEIKGAIDDTTITFKTRFYHNLHLKRMCRSTHLPNIGNMVNCVKIFKVLLKQSLQQFTTEWKTIHQIIDQWY